MCRILQLTAETSEATERWETVTMPPKNASKAKANQNRDRREQRQRQSSSSRSSGANGSFPSAPSLNSQALNSDDLPWHATQTRLPVPNREKYKTEMCYNVAEFNTCKFGQGCVFAHEKSELRFIEKHPNYRTQPCRDYHGELALCVFGGRCSFIHKRPALLSRKEQEKQLGEKIDQYTRHAVRDMLQERGIQKKDIRQVEQLPSVILRLLRRALTSQHGEQTAGRWSLPAEIQQKLDYVEPKTLTYPISSVGRSV